jgi:threonine dehydrogenase-like Zn-dependent dehydrogenase
MARAQGAEVINFDKEDPVEIIFELTGGIGVDRVIEAIGIDAERVHSGPVAEQGEQTEEQFQQELNQVALPVLVGLVATGALNPTEILTQREPVTSAIDAYEAFDRREPGWIKVELQHAA